MRNLARVLTALVATLFSVGCNGKGILFHEETSLSVSAQAKASTPELAGLSVGYRRRVTAIVPEMEESPCQVDGQPQLCREAQSLISIFELKGDSDGGPRDLVVRNNFATGRAARELAEAEGPVPTTDASGQPQTTTRTGVEVLREALSDEPLP